MHWHGYVQWDTLEDYFEFLMYSAHRLKAFCVYEIDVIQDDDEHRETYRKYVTKFHRIKKTIIKHTTTDKIDVDGILKYFGNKKSKKYDKDLIDLL